jgi:hypothetical protein
MAISLTCVCGARFELEDILAGQTITCPECQQAIKAPVLQKTPLRTSNLALASMVLALVGAFTLIGTAVATLLGVMALVEIGRHRDKVAGVGLALFGIIAGIGLTALTGFALFSGEVFGFGPNVREAMLADEIDTSGPLEIIDGAGGFAITRPSKKWGVAFNKEVDDPLVQGLLHKDADLLLVKPSPYVFLDVKSESVNGRRMDDCQQSVLEEFQPEPEMPWINPPGRMRPPRGQRGLDPDNPFQPTGYSNLKSHDFDVPGGEGRELRLDVKCAGKNWPFFIRLIRTNMGKLYVVRAYGPSRKQFKEADAEVQQALDSFRVLPGR